MRYALVDDQGNVSTFASNVDPTVATRPPWRWVPVTEPSVPAHDPTTQKLTGPTYTVNQGGLVGAYDVVDKTAEEIDAEKAAVVDACHSSILLRVLLNHENRIRALESKAPMTAQQFKTALKGML